MRACSDCLSERFEHLKGIRVDKWMHSLLGGEEDSGAVCAGADGFDSIVMTDDHLSKKDIDLLSALFDCPCTTTSPCTIPLERRVLLQSKEGSRLFSQRCRGQSGCEERVVIKAYSLCRGRLPDEAICEIYATGVLASRRDASIPFIMDCHGMYYDMAESSILLVRPYCASREGHVCPSEAALRRMVSSLLRALAACHEMGIVHGDVKPSNTFAAEGGAALLGDFGCASPISAGWSSRLLFNGTLAFMSPQRCLPQQNGIVPESAAEESHSVACEDTWSLGITAWMFATGSHPFLSSSAMEASREGPWHVLSVLTRIVSDSDYQKQPVQFLGDLSEKKPLPFSTGLTDFLSLCLQPSFKTRPLASQLLHHPWVQGGKQSKDVGQFL